MTVFVSYSGRGRDAVNSLTRELQDAGEQLQKHQRLAGGPTTGTRLLTALHQERARRQPVVTGVLTVIGAVVLAVFLSGCRSPSADQASTASSSSAAPSSGEQGPTGQGPYGVTATVPSGKSPNGVAVDPSTHTVYVTNRDDNTVSVIDGATRAVTATVPVGKDPFRVAVDPGTHTVYVAHIFDNMVSVID
ncbi:MAG: YncE family protein, partial [Mycobacterium sp.]